jgi:hypothetical protein
MNTHEAERIAAAMHEARPDWPTSSVLTLIRKSLLDKPRRDVFVALAWVASEPNSHTPARVLESGPWWRAAGVEGATSKREQPGRDERCSVCSEAHAKCRQVWADDHEFEAASTAAKRKAESNPKVIANAVAALKADLPPMREPERRKGLEDLADRNPELRARVDALRAAIPPGPPMREITEEESA